MIDYIVSLTSWKGRINDVGLTIYSFLTQSIPPKKIILNLSTAEFTSTTMLPRDVKLLLKSYFPFFEINWVTGKNTKAFKKVIPTIQRYRNDNYAILAGDDDMLYLPSYAEFMLSLLSTYPKKYFTPGTWGKHVHGYAMIYNPKWFSDDLLYSLSPLEMDNICSSDLWISDVLAHENIAPMVVPEIANMFIDMKKNDTALSKQYTAIPYETRRNACIKAIRRYYGK